MTSSAARSIEARPGRGPLVLVFVVTWLAYASSYLARKNLSVVKVRLRASMGITNETLASIETGYLIAYALGQFANGVLGDRIGGRRLVSIGLFGVTLATAVFGASSAAVLLAIAFACNGVAQSAGWPGNNRVLEEWTTPSDRGAVMGIWSTCYQVGGIVASALAAWLLAHFGWRAAFYVPAAWIAGIAMVAFFALPRDAPTSRSRESRADAGVSWRTLLRDPTLWRYGGCYFCIKLMRYSLLFWLPLYLHDALGYEESRAGYLSTAFEVGGVAGAIGFGMLSDRLPRVARAHVVASGLVGLAVALVVYVRVGHTGVAAQFIAMALVGSMLFGPDALVSGAASQELGGSEAASTAVGFVNGIGSLGAALQGWVTLGVSRRYGWNALFEVFGALAIVGALLVGLGGAQRPNRESASRA